MTGFERPSVLSAFDVDAFDELRRQRRLEIGTPLTLFESTASTNDEAKRAALLGAPSGSLYVAEYQSEGRGRSDHRWLSAARENLLFSVLLRPSFSIGMLRAFSLVVGLAVRRALENHGATGATIKWPNDVLVGRRKLAGILIESDVDGGRIANLVVGIGINVNSTGFAGEIAETALSLRSMIGTPANRELVLADVLEALTGLMGAYERGGLAALRSELECHDALRDRTVVVDGKRGIGAGIGTDGALLVDTEEGLEAVYSGSVTWAD